MCRPAILPACPPTVVLSQGCGYSQRVVTVMDRSDVTKAQSCGGEMRC